MNVTTPGGQPSLFSDALAGRQRHRVVSGVDDEATSGTVDTQTSAGSPAFNNMSGAYARAQLTGVAARSQRGGAVLVPLEPTGPSATSA